MVSLDSSHWVCHCGKALIFQIPVSCLYLMTESQDVSFRLLFHLYSCRCAVVLLNAAVVMDFNPLKLSAHEKHFWPWSWDPFTTVIITKKNVSSILDYRPVVSFVIALLLKKHLHVHIYVHVYNISVYVWVLSIIFHQTCVLFFLPSQSVSFISLSTLTSLSCYTHLCVSYVHDMCAYNFTYLYKI